MARTPNSICAICGKPYYCCSDSQSMKTITPWKRIVDSLEHYKIFLALKNYTNGMVTKEETKKVLQNCNLSDRGTYIENIEKTIQEILSDNTQSKTEKVNKIQKEPEVKKINE